MEYLEKIKNTRLRDGHGWAKGFEMLFKVEETWEEQHSIRR